MNNALIDIENILTNYFFSRAQELGYGQPSEWRDHLIEAGILDSVEIVTLIAFTESEFGIKWKDDDIQMEHLSSIRNLASFIRNCTI